MKFISIFDDLSAFLLFFQRKGETSHQIALDKEVGVIDTRLQDLLHRPIQRSGELFATVLNILLDGVFDLSVFEGEEVVGRFLHGDAIGAYDTQIDGLDAGCAGDVLEDGVVELQLLNL